MESETCREEIPVRDKTRTARHNAVLTQMKILNRMAEAICSTAIYFTTCFVMQYA